VPGLAVTAAPALIAGWYGKLPALGDFASRRLPPGFIDAWDAWLQRGLASSRASLGARWLDAYLNGPLWNFVLLPGVCGDAAWTGTIMPSVDKVGRHFPLTIALELPPHPALLATLVSAQAWYAAIDQATLACLDIHCLPETLEARLARLPLPGYPFPGDDAGPQLERWLAEPAPRMLALHLSGSIAVADVFAAAALTRLGRAAGARSFWWSDTSAGAATRLLAFAGLPAHHEFTALMDRPEQSPA
jgi:type VI secretion system protein ImpM